MRLTAAVGSLCVQATGRRNFQSVSPSNWSVRTKQEPGKGRKLAAAEGNTDTPRWQQQFSLVEKRDVTIISIINPGNGCKFVYFRRFLRPLMTDLPEEITQQMVTILKQQSGGTLQSWNIHNPLPVMAACIILFLSWFRFFIIDLIASTWRRDNQPPCSAEKSGCFSVSPDWKTQWPHATGFNFGFLQGWEWNMWWSCLCLSALNTCK